MEKRQQSYNEPLSEQTAAILKVEQQIVRAIWADVPTYASAAYESLEGRFDAGYDVASHRFWAQEADVIRRSVRGFNAKVRQTFVEDAFAELLERLKDKEKEGIVELFPRSSESVYETLSILDIYSHEQELLSKALKDPHEQARQDIIKNVVERDALAKIGLSRPDPFAEGFFIADIHNNTRVIVTPTSMNGVTLRFRHPVGRNTPIVEFVLHKVA